MDRRWLPNPTTRALWKPIALITTIVIVAGCAAKVEPKAIAGIGPIECSVNTDLRLSCSIGREWMFALGPVKIGVGFDGFPATNGALILVVKQADGTAEAWRVGDDDRPLCLEQVGSFVTRIGRNIVEITPMLGATFRITDPRETGKDCTGTSTTLNASPSESSDVIVVTVQSLPPLPPGHGPSTPTRGQTAPPPTATLAPPNSPTNLTATVLSSSTIRLQWQDNSNNEARFVIHGGVNVGGVWSDSEPTVAANSTSYDWGGLSPATQICFIIWASNAAGNSDYFAAGQEWVCATTLES